MNTWACHAICKASIRNCHGVLGVLCGSLGLADVDWFNNRRFHGGTAPGPGHTTPANREADYYRQNVPIELVRNMRRSLHEIGAIQ